MSRQADINDPTRYSVKPAEYYQHARYDILQLVEPLNKRILDVGCGDGVTGVVLKDRGAKEVIGIEYVVEAADRARILLDKVLAGDINEIRLDFAPDYFDLILCLDVLEHLPYPEDTLARLIPFLSDNGQFVISLPNVRYLGTLKKLVVQADWPREVSGVFDGTHLRWFTSKSAARMFDQLDLRILRRQRIPLAPINKLPYPSRWMDRLLPDWFTIQFVYLLEKRR